MRNRLAGENQPLSAAARRQLGGLVLLPGFDELLLRVAQAWGEQRERLRAQGDAIVRQLGQTLPAPHAGDGDEIAP